jgi:catechol 2,3-dioxygenase-like lactoylglutathione lyase family enzyme
VADFTPVETDGTAIEFAGMNPLLRVMSTSMTGVRWLLVCVGLQAVVFAAGVGEHAERPRITGIDHVTIYVSDVTKSRAFYSNVLGLTPGCPCYGGPGSCFLIRPSERRLLLKPAPAGVRKNVHQSWLAEVGFATDSVLQMRDYVRANGFRPGPMQKDSDGAQYFHVQDPEGNSIAFVHRPRAKAGYGAGSKQLSSHLIHAGFVVKDLAAENRFYVDLLGFRLYWYGGFKDEGTDWYELQAPDGSDWIEYMLNIPANADHHELGVQNHFSFGVKDVHAAAVELRAREFKTFDGPEVGRDGKDSLDAYDPDGTRVEIMELTPVEKPCCHPYTADHPKP